MRRLARLTVLYALSCSDDAACRALDRALEAPIRYPTASAEPNQ